MADLTQLTEVELREGYHAYDAEINRRYELQRIPERIMELADQGRQIGVEEQAMVDAVTKHPDPDADPDADTDTDTDADTGTDTDPDTDPGTDPDADTDTESA